MVNTVSGSDFATLYEPAVGENSKKGSGFKDALNQVSKKENAESENHEKEAFLQGAQNTILSAPGMQWMSALWNQEMGPVSQMNEIGSRQLAGVPIIQIPEEKMIHAAESQKESMQNQNVQMQGAALAVQEQMPLDQKSFHINKSGQEEKTETVLQQKNEEKSEAVKMPELVKEAKQSEKAETEPKGIASLSGEYEVKRNEDENAALQNLSVETSEIRDTYRGERTEAFQSLPISEGKETGRTASMEELPEVILQGIREEKSELEIRLEPETLGKLTIKASLQEGRAVISILCSDAKTAEILSVHARELGTIMETNLGSPAEIILDGNAPENSGDNYPDGHADNRGDNGQGGERRQHKKESESFLQQLRLGLV